MKVGCGLKEALHMLPGDQLEVFLPACTSSDRGISVRLRQAPEDAGHRCKGLGGHSWAVLSPFSHLEVRACGGRMTSNVKWPELAGPLVGSLCNGAPNLSLCRAGVWWGNPSSPLLPPPAVRADLVIPYFNRQAAQTLWPNELHGGGSPGNALFLWVGLVSLLPTEASQVA